MFGRVKPVEFSYAGPKDPDLLRRLRRERGLFRPEAALGPPVWVAWLGLRRGDPSGLTP